MLNHKEDEMETMIMRFQGGVNGGRVLLQGSCRLYFLQCLQLVLVKMESHLLPLHRLMGHLLAV